MGIDVSPTVVERPLKLVVKPYGQFWKNKRWWSKIEVYPIEKDMRVYTRKVDYGPLNLQVGFGVRQQQPPLLLLLLLLFSFLSYSLWKGRHSNSNASLRVLQSWLQITTLQR